MARWTARVIGPVVLGLALAWALFSTVERPEPPFSVDAAPTILVMPSPGPVVPRVAAAPAPAPEPQPLQTPEGSPAKATEAEPKPEPTYEDLTEAIRDIVEEIGVPPHWVGCTDTGKCSALWEMSDELGWLEILDVAHEWEMEGDVAPIRMMYAVMADEQEQEPGFMALGLELADDEAQWFVDDLSDYQAGNYDEMRRLYPVLFEE